METEEIHEYVFRCTKCGGQAHVQAPNKEKAETWLKEQSGFCPAGGNHVELLFSGYFEYVGESSEVHRIPPEEEKFKAAITKMLELVRKGTAVLTAGSIGIPTIHSIKNADHYGFGAFGSKYDKDGNPLAADHVVGFDAGGAMNQAPKPIYGWSCFTGDVAEWGYPFQEVEQRLSKLLTMKPEEAAEKWNEE